MSEQDYCAECGTRFDADESHCRHCGAARPQPAPAPSDQLSAETAASLEALTAELRDALAPRLQLLKLLGHGGMGEVFLARDPALKRLVVVKVLSPDLAHDERARRRFEREAESAAAVAHPNVVGVHEVGQLPRSGTSYFVMQHVDGSTLAEAFPVGTVVPVARARRIVGEVASALAAAHARGLVHRDIKPANIMLERDTDRVVVLDFGISAVISPERRSEIGTKLTQAGTSIGTPQYMSPEQAAGESVTDRSDIYSLGVVAFELLAGRALFEETTPMALAAAHINKPPPPVETVRPDVDAAFAQLVDACLGKDPVARPSAEQVVRSLGVQAQHVIEWPPPGLDVLHHLGARFATALYLAVAVGMLFFILLFDPPTWGSPSWTGGEGSGLWFLVGGGCCGGSHFTDPRWDPTPIWLVLLVLLIVAEAGLAAFAVAQASRLGSLLMRARRSGYPLTVCLDAAFDASPDTGAVLNGTGPYAALVPEARERVRRWRRWRSGVLAAAPLLAVLAVVIWLLAWGGGGTPAERIVTGPALGLLLAPLLAATIAFVTLAAQERSLVGRRGLTLRQSLARWRQSLVMRDVAVTWLRSVGTQEVPTSAGRATGLVAAGYLVAALALLVLIAGMSLVSIVTLRTSATVMHGRQEARQWQQARRPWAKLVTWAQVDSAARSLFLSSDLRTVPDTEADVAFLDVLTAGLEPEVRRAWRASGRPSAATMPGYPAELSRNDGWPDLSPWSVFHKLLVQRGRMPDAIRHVAEQNLASPAYVAWKRFAHATPLPLWYYATDFGGAMSPLMLAPLDWDSTLVRGLIQTSLLEVLFAAKRSDRAAALAAASELVTIGFALAPEPTVISHDIGLYALYAGLYAVRELGRAGLVPGLTARASAADQLRGRWPSHDWWLEHGFPPEPVLLVADPASSTAREALAGMNPSGAPGEGQQVTALEPLDRWSLIEAVVPAFCTSPREVLLGIDPRRAELLRSALAKQGAVPRTDEWIRLNLRWFEQWRDRPSAAGARWDGTRPAVPALARPLGWIGLRGIRDRIAFCSESVWQ